MKVRIKSAKYRRLVRWEVGQRNWKRAEERRLAEIRKNDAELNSRAGKIITSAIADFEQLSTENKIEIEKWFYVGKVWALYEFAFQNYVETPKRIRESLLDSCNTVDKLTDAGVDK